MSKSTIISDLKRIDAMSDEDIDYSDIPALDSGFFQQARVVESPGKKRLSHTPPPPPP
jgi:hypothetical protein